MTDPTDARLGILVRDCWPALLRTGYLMTGDPVAARSLVEDALRRRLGDVRDGTSDPAAALRIAVVREAFRHRSLHVAGAAPFAEQSGSAEPMREVLRRLPLDERAVLVLRLRERLAVEQVVDVLRVPRGVVVEREDRAVRALRSAGLVPQGEPRPDELRGMLDSVAEQVPAAQPPDVQELLETASTGRGLRILVISAGASVVAAVAAVRWLL